MNVTLNLSDGDGDNEYVVCQPSTTGQPEQALFNRVTLSQPGQPDRDADACGDLPLFDWGDLPASYGTLAANNGANHRIVPGVYLGAALDAETNGQPNAAANGDDNNPVAAPDDEDGVVFLTPLTALTPGTPITLAVTASTPGYLNAWFDWNDNGLLDGGEQSFVDTSLVAGVNTLSVLMPATADPAEFYSRFRFTTGSAV